MNQLIFILLSSLPFLQDSVRQLLSSYLSRFSTLAGPVITCGPVLNWDVADSSVTLTDIIIKLNRSG